MATKLYTIRIDKRSKKRTEDLWYKKHIGEEFTATLAISDEPNGSMLPVFKRNVAPFYSVYPEDCTVIEERVFENKK
jgi:hypothetical protein